MMRSMPPVFAVLALLAACGDESGTGPDVPEPVSGTLALELTTPHADDGAIILNLAGPAPIAAGSLRSPRQDLLVFARSTSSGARAFVAGGVSTGVILRFDVPDVSKAASYSATVDEVADRSNMLRETVAGYSVRITAQ